MKAGWKIKPLGELCEFQRGLTYTKSDEVESSDNVVLRATNINLATNLLDLTELRYIKNRVAVPNDKKVKKDSLIVCTASGSKSHLGKVAYVDDDYGYAFGGFMGMITPKNGLMPKYLFHFMTSCAYKDFIGELSDGANINNLKYDDLKKFPVPHPDRIEQQRIVGVLDEAFAGLAVAKANAEKNLRNARALFASHLQSVFECRGKSWMNKKLGDVLIKTETIDPTREPQADFEYIDVSSISNETLTIQTTQRLKGKDAPSRARRLIRSKDVLFATIRPTLRRIAIVPDELDKQVCSTGYFVLRANLNINHRLIYYFLQTASFMASMEMLQRGASYPAVSDGDVRNQIITVPPMPEQQRIIEVLDAISAETQRLALIYEQKQTALEALKKSLLHQAFNGEL